MIYRRVLLANALLACAVACAQGQTADHAAILPFLADDVDDVALIDLTKIDFPAALEEMVKLGAVPVGELDQARQQAAEVQLFFKQVTALGTRRLYVLVRPADVIVGGTTWVLEMADSSDPKAFVAQLKPWIATAQNPKLFGDVGDILPKELEVVGNVIIGGPSAERVAAIKAAAAKSSPPRPEALAALAQLDGADLGVVLFGSADSRRVVREMWPAAPAPFAELTGAFLVDGLRSIALTAKLPPEPSATLAFEATSAEAAATLDKAAQKALVLAQAVALKESVSAVPMHRARGVALAAALPLVEPKLNGSRLSVTVSSDQKTIDAFNQIVLPAVDSARTAAQRSQRMNNFKQIMLGMLNYESAKKSYPPLASRDANGKPLLSWRVLILPYIEQQALYNQFHLDEPWDSEHNIKLINTMPAPYLDPRLSASELAAGRTTVLVPRGDKTIFRGADGLKIRGVTDGTSNTIALASVTPERAVVWTKPDDWEVDLANPLRGVKGADGEGFITGFADGSVRFIANSVDPANLAAMLTADGGEVVSQ